MANEILAPGLFVQTNMAVPNVGMNEGPNWGGSSMAPLTVVPLLPALAFSARGRGGQSLVPDVALQLNPTQGSRLSGTQGSIDLLVTMATAGTARTLCFLTDSLATPTKYIAVKIDTSNRPFVTFTNNLGVVIAAGTPGGSAIASGTPVAIRMTWDSQNVVDVATTRHATLRVNREFVPSADWTTNPLVSWTSFQPQFVMLGGSLGDADFNGTIAAAQFSNVVTP